MDNTILQYQISDWHQLKDCQSNNSPELKIKVGDYIQNKDIVGTKVEVFHTLYGTLFAYTIAAKGDLITDITCWCQQDELMNGRIFLNELKKYGFYVDFVEEASLQYGQVELLRTVQGLHFDKLRLVSVHQDNDKSMLTNYICVFNILKNPNWVNSGYSPSQTEWEQAIINGSALNVSGLEYAERFDWSWVYNAIYDIDEILSRYDDDSTSDEEDEF